MFSIWWCWASPPSVLNKTDLNLIFLNGPGFTQRWRYLWDRRYVHQRHTFSRLKTPACIKPRPCRESLSAAQRLKRLLRFIFSLKFVFMQAVKNTFQLSENLAWTQEPSRAEMVLISLLDIWDSFNLIFFFFFKQFQTSLWLQATASQMTFTMQINKRMPAAVVVAFPPLCPVWLY